MLPTEKHISDTSFFPKTYFHAQSSCLLYEISENSLPSFVACFSLKCWCWAYQGDAALKIPKHSLSPALLLADPCNGSLLQKTTGKQIPSWEMGCLSCPAKQHIVILPNFSLLGCPGMPHTEGDFPSLKHRSQGGCWEELRGSSQLWQPQYTQRTKESKLHGWGEIFHLQSCGFHADR